MRLVQQGRARARSSSPKTNGNTPKRTSAIGRLPPAQRPRCGTPDHTAIAPTRKLTPTGSGQGSPRAGCRSERRRATTTPGGPCSSPGAGLRRVQPPVRKRLLRGRACWWSSRASNRRGSPDRNAAMPDMSVGDTFRRIWRCEPLRKGVGVESAAGCTERWSADAQSAGLAGVETMGELQPRGAGGWEPGDLQLR